MELKANLLDESGVTRALMRISHEIIEYNKGVDNVVLVGINSRGVPLAKKIREIIYRVMQVKLPVGELDIDFNGSRKGNLAVKRIELGDGVQGKNVVIVNDVMFTGRTVHEAIETILSKGEVLSIQLAVLIDRGHRELPLRPDYVGKNVPSSKRELVSVNIPPCDDHLGVDIYEL